jgi:hypothetical protein
LPEPLPDALGVAIKLPNTHGPGADQDLLLTSSTDRPLLRRLLFPARSFAHGAFSTALPYDLGNDRVVLLLVPAHSSAGRSADGDDHHVAGGALAELRAAARQWTRVRALDRPILRPLPTAGHPEDRPALASRANRSPALQPLDHRTRDPPGRLAEPAPRRRLPGEPTRP